MPLDKLLGQRWTDITLASTIKSWQCPPDRKWFVKNVFVYHTQATTGDRVFRPISITIASDQFLFNRGIISGLIADYDVPLSIPVNCLVYPSEVLCVYLEANYSPLTLTSSQAMIYCDVVEYMVNEYVPLPSIMAVAPRSAYARAEKNIALASTNAVVRFFNLNFLKNIRAFRLTVTEQNVNDVQITVHGRTASNASPLDEIIAVYDVVKNTTVIKYMVESATMVLPWLITVGVNSKVADVHGSIKAWMEVLFQ